MHRRNIEKKLRNFVPCLYTSITMRRCCKIKIMGISKHIQCCMNEQYATPSDIHE